MRNPTTIPTGWRKLEIDEVIQTGDQYYNGFSGRWVDCVDSVGQKYNDYGLEFVKPSNCVAITKRSPITYKVGDRVVVIGSQQTPEVIGCAGTIVHVRKSRLHNENSYFIDFDKLPEKFGFTDCLNFRAEFLKLESQCYKPVEVKLNAAYVAKVEQNAVKVGCQTFSFEAVEELYNQVQAAKNFKS